MIDCSKTENYLVEKQRMTEHQKNGTCKLKCTDCPLSIGNNGTDTLCQDFETLYPKKAIAIVQKWSNTHPQKTYLTELLEKYPNALIGDDGTPEGLCPHYLGLKDNIDACKKGYNCAECWNQPIEESESK